MIFSQLQEILAELFDTTPDAIAMNTDFLEDLDADSLDIMEFIMILEEEFDFEALDQMDLSPYRTVGDVVEFLERSGRS